MLKSMTGYGSGEAEFMDGSLYVEARSVNHRFLEVSVRTPRWLSALEGNIRQEIKARFRRGRFDVFISLTNAHGTDALPLLDRGIVRDYVQALRLLKEELGLPGEVDLQLLVQFRELLRAQDPRLEAEETWSSLREALSKALDSVEGMRLKEGAATELDIRRHLEKLHEGIKAVKERASEAIGEGRRRLQERIQKLLGETPVEPGRLEQEVLFFAERSDVSEEVSRLESHLEQFRSLLQQDEPQGRRLDFLLQEMYREANTISAKGSDLSLSQIVVELKSELEKLREQVQNVE